MRLDTALEICHQVRKRTADLRDHDLSSWLQLKKVLEYIPTTPSRIFALPAVIQGSVAIVENRVAAFCACCGAEITLKTEACTLCGAPQHGMLQPDSSYVRCNHRTISRRRRIGPEPRKLTPKWGKSAISSFKATDIGSFCKVHLDERERR